jgi:hypothetical protein
MAEYQEKDLYQPVKTLFESLGFAVKAEVLNCDMIAVRGDVFICVELKSKLNLEVILQAVDRQKLVELSYLAVPEWGLPKSAKRKKDIEHLLKRLEIGFVVVSKQGMSLVAHIESDAIAFNRSLSMARNKNKQLALKKEFKLRVGDGNVGGSTRTKRMTAYKQDAIAFALLIEMGIHEQKLLLKQSEHLALKGKVLKDNFYGWFEKTEKGKFGLTKACYTFLDSLNDVQKKEFLQRVSPMAYGCEE